MNLDQSASREFGQSLNSGSAAISPVPVSDRTARLILSIDRIALGASSHWLLYSSIFLGILVLTPFAAPALMAAGIRGPAKIIYFFYGFLCHQLPERSYFLFGPKVSYSLTEIGRVWNYQDLLTLRQFIGNSEMGWKVAWSDRMVSLFGGAWIAGLLYALVSRRLPPLSPLVWFFLGVLPIGLDGITHVINDVLAGLSGMGFRDTNAWLVFLTGNTLPAAFYAGDALGSFNSVIRLVTGALFGILSVCFVYPILGREMHRLAFHTRERLSSPRALELKLGLVDQPTLQKGQ